MKEHIKNLLKNPIITLINTSTGVYVCMCGCVCVYVCVCLYLGRVMGGSGGGGGGGYRPCPSLPIVSYLLRNASVARVLRGE